MTTAEDLGSPITATDSDGDTLTYTLGGLDAAKFDLDASSGQLATKVGESYDREATASYSVTVTATDPDTDSDSVAVTITVDNATEVPLAPGAPTAGPDIVNRSNTDVIWTAPTNVGRPMLLTYDVQYRTGANPWESQSVPANKTFVTLTGLTADTIYEFQVRAVNLDGNGAWSDSLTYRTGVAATVPGAPTSFTATAGDGEVMLAWEPVSETGGALITEFQYRHAAGTTVPEGTNWNTVPDSGDSGTDLYDERSFTVTSLTNDTEYAFELRAVNAVGGGTKAGPITATPIAPPLVSNIEQSVSNNSSATLGTGSSSRDLHQAFTTGAVGARLTSIKIKLASLSASQPLPTMTLHKGSATSAAIATLSTTGRASGFNANYTYTAPANTILAAATTYYVVVQGGGNSVYARATDSDSEDSGSETGWSVADGYGWRGASSTGDFTIDSRALMIHVDGTLASENTAATGTPTITAPDTDPATVGTTLTATAGDIADADGLPSTFTYQWSRVDADGTSNEEAIAGATESTYVMAADDVGKKVTVALTFTDTLGSEETRTSAVYPETGTIVAAVAACAAPDFGTRRNIWTGTVTVGMIATVAYGFSSLAGSLDDKTFTIGSNNYEIDGVSMFTAGPDAGDINFSLKDSDLTSAEKAALRLHVCNADYNFSAGVLINSTHTYVLLADLDWSSLSSRTLYLSLPPNNAATGKPEISGTATVGQTLMAAKGTIADADGLPTTFTYQWVRVDGLTETDITGATSSTYTLAGAASGKKLKVKVGFTDNLSGEEERTSAATGTVTTVTTPVALVSNIGQSDDRNYNVGTGFVGQDLAQGFTTGTSGATLTRIEIRMDTSSGTQSSVPTATLHRGSPTSAAVATLTGPSEIANAAANYAFTAPANTTLAASTTYYVVLEGGVVDIRARVTNSDNEDGGAETGWSVADGGGFRRDSSTAAFTDISQALLIRVNGTVTTAPGAPQDLKVSAGDGKVDLSWAAPASDGGGAITEYEYRYSAGATVSASATWTDVTDGSDDGDSTADETGVTVSSLTNGTQYAFEVRAVNSAGDGAAAGPVTATPVTVPGAPQDFKVSAGDAQVVLTWGAPASDGGAAITEFEYRYSAGAAVAPNAIWTDVADGSDNGNSTADETSVTISSLINGTEYAFEVRAVNSEGGGAAAGPVTATPVAPTAPGAPAVFTATAGNGKVDLSWGAPVSDGGASITKYRYRYSTGATVSASATWADVPDGSDSGSSAADERSVTVSSLTNTTQYAFEVLAVNSVGEGAAAGPATATPTTTPITRTTTIRLGDFDGRTQVLPTLLLTGGYTLVIIFNGITETTGFDTNDVSVSRGRVVSARRSTTTRNTYVVKILVEDAVGGNEVVIGVRPNAIDQGSLPVSLTRTTDAPMTTTMTTSATEPVSRDFTVVTTFSHAAVALTSESSTGVIDPAGTETGTRQVTTTNCSLVSSRVFNTTRVTLRIRPRAAFQGTCRVVYIGGILQHSTQSYTSNSEGVLDVRVDTRTPPGAPTSFMATVDDGEVTLSWEAPASDGGDAITEYEYRYSEGDTVSAGATWTDVTDGGGGRRGSDAVVGGARERRRRGDHGIRVPLLPGRHGVVERDLDRRGRRQRFGQQHGRRDRRHHIKPDQRHAVRFRGARGEPRGRWDQGRSGHRDPVYRVRAGVEHRPEQRRKLSGGSFQ